MRLEQTEIDFGVATHYEKLGQDGEPSHVVYQSKDIGDFVYISGFLRSPEHYVVFSLWPGWVEVVDGEKVLGFASSKHGSGFTRDLFDARAIASGRVDISGRWTLNFPVELYGETELEAREIFQVVVLAMRQATQLAT